MAGTEKSRIVLAKTQRRQVGIRQFRTVIRSRTEGAPAESDGPPLSRGEAARFRQHLADGVHEAYAAFYRPTESSDEIIAVYGARLAENADASFEDWRRRARPNATRVTIGAISVAVHGGRSQCSDAIAAYLTTLASK